LTSNHLLVIEAYEGHLECISDEPEERAAAQGLGLPLNELAERLDCRITVLSWDGWQNWEQGSGAPSHWVPRPATRPLTPRLSPVPSELESERVHRRPLPAREPLLDHPLWAGLSPRSYGLIANNDLLFFASYCVREELIRLAKEDPFDMVLIPMWTGIGYVAQLTRAVGTESALEVPFVAVVTGRSADRHDANQEGHWTLEATIRRQMEDVSLALADQAIIFGRRGEGVATEGRLASAPLPLTAPRRIPARLLDRIAEVAEIGAERANGSKTDTKRGLQFFMREPQDASSGVLALLDAVDDLVKQGNRPDRPVICTGPDTIFAPMSPRSFRSYWSSRGFVQHLIDVGAWLWDSPPPAEAERLTVRLYPSHFEHLPAVWHEIADGSLPVLSPAAAEGLLPGDDAPQEIVLTEVSAAAVAGYLRQLSALQIEVVEERRRSLCRRVVEGHRGTTRERLLDELATGLREHLQAGGASQDLSRVARLTLDRRRSLRALSTEVGPSPRTMPSTHVRDGALTVVVTCFRMGALLEESVRSIWRSSRRPDEVIVIDDGSEDIETRTTLAELQRYASAERLPLRVVYQLNAGLAAARNRGLAEAGCEYISFLDGDDLVEADFYRLSTDLLSRHPTLGGVAAWAICFGDRVPDGFWNAPQPELPTLLVQNAVIVPCVMRTDTLRALGGYDTQQRYNYEDWELSVRLLAGGWPIVTLPHYLTRYRERPESMLRTMTAIQNQVMRERLYSRHRETVDRFSVELAMLLEDRRARLEETASLAGTPADGRWLRNSLESARRFTRFAWARLVKSSAGR
jgi:glycosyltransferase involved in cell wall biosynthesis